MVAAESGAPLSRPWCANPRALGGAREDPLHPPAFCSQQCHPPRGAGGSGDVQGCFAGSRPGIRTARPRCLSFVSTAQRLAQPLPGRVTALGDSGAWVQECPAWELCWALLAVGRLRSGRRQETPPAVAGKGQVQRDHGSALAAPQPTAWARHSRLQLRPQAPTSLRDEKAHHPPVRVYLGLGEGPKPSVCRVPCILTKAIGGRSYYYK